MINSKYINEILELLLDSDKDGLFARQQIPFIVDKNFDYTSGGLFVYFEHKVGIENYQVDNQNLVLDGIKIKSDEHKIEAQATLFFKNGLIDNLEIWCYEGDYPNNDLTSYILTQTWLDSDNKTISK